MHPKGVRTEVCQSCKLSQYFNLRKVAGRIMIQDGGDSGRNSAPNQPDHIFPKKNLEFPAETTVARISKMIYSEARFFVMVLRCSELEASAPRLQSSKSELQSRGDPRNFTAKLKPRPRGLERYSL